MSEEHKRVLVHASKLRVKKAEFREPSTRIPGHNFAIRLVQTIETQMEKIREAFSTAATGPRTTGKRRSVSHEAIDRPTFVQILRGAVRDHIISTTGTTWLQRVTVDELEQRLGEVFDSATGVVGRSILSFDEFMSYVIDCNLAGEIGLVEERVPEFEASGSGILRNMETTTRARYCPELKKILTAGRHVGLVDTATMQTRVFHYAANPNDKLPYVYDADYVPHLNAALVTGTEMSVQLIGLDRGKRLFSIPVTETHSTCCFDRGNNLAICGTRASDVITYRLPQNRTSENKFETGRVMRHHKDSVTRVECMVSGLYASASHDSTVVIADLESGEPLTRFVGHGTAGVNALHFLPEVSMMASGAFDIEVKLWLVSSAASKKDSFSLRDHEMPHVGHVVDICHVPSTPQVTTCDVHGLIKLWDIRTMRCVQNLRGDRLTASGGGIIDSASMKWHSIVWDDSTQDLCVVSKRRMQKLKRSIPAQENSKLTTAIDSAKREPCVSDNYTHTDEQPIVGVAMNHSSQIVMTWGENKLRCWDAFAGRQEVLHDNLEGTGAAVLSPSKKPSEPSGISAVCANDSGKVMFVGRRGGGISAHAFSTGVRLFTYVEDNAGHAEVLTLTYLTGTNAFAAVTYGGCLVYPDLLATENGGGSSYGSNENMKPFYPDVGRGIEVKCAQWDPVFGILSVGERSGNVQLWESRRGRFTHESVRSIGSISCGEVEVNVVMLLAGFSAVAVADNHGRLTFFTTMPHPFPNRKFAETLLKNREVTAMAFYPPKQILYVADDGGDIRAINVADQLASVGVHRPSASWEALMASVGRRGTPPKSVEALDPFVTIRAHSDIITGLAWVLGSSVLVSTSVDRRVLAWNLSLECRGVMDPEHTDGTYSAPFSQPVGFEYVVEAPLDEHLGAVTADGATDDMPSLTRKRSLARRFFTGSQPGSSMASRRQSVADMASQRGGRSPRQQQQQPPPEDDGVSAAGRYDAEILKTAMALEAVFKEQTTSRSMEKASMVAKLNGYAPSAHSMANAERGPVVKDVLPPASTASPQQLQGGDSQQIREQIQQNQLQQQRHRRRGSLGPLAISGNDQPVGDRDLPGGEDPADVRDVYSVNSTGVDCHSLLTPLPEAKHFKRKQHVVDRNWGEREGLEFMVTRDFPLPANARAERDFLLRQLKDREEVAAQHAANTRGKQYLVAIDGATLDVTNSGFAPMPERHVHRSGLPRRQPARNTLTPGQRNKPNPTDSALRTLLPKDLIALRRAPVQGKRATTPTIFNSTVGASRGMSPLPLPGREQRSLTPDVRLQGRDDIAWQAEGGPASSAMTSLSETTASDRSSQRFRSSSHAVERRVHHQSPIHPPSRRSLHGGGSSRMFFPEDAEAPEPVGFMSFGVRSINDRLMTPDPSNTRLSSGGKPFVDQVGFRTVWSKTHDCDGMEQYDRTETAQIDVTGSFDAEEATDLVSRIVYDEDGDDVDVGEAYIEGQEEDLGIEEDEGEEPAESDPAAIAVGDDFH